MCIYVCGSFYNTIIDDLRKILQQCSILQSIFLCRNNIVCIMIILQQCNLLFLAAYYLLFMLHQYNRRRGEMMVSAQFPQELRRQMSKSWLAKFPNRRL